MPEFKEFGKIAKYSPLKMVITQKLNGTNAQIHIFAKEDGELDLVCGSRNRWIYPDDDNFGFAAFVHENKAEFIEKLGVGTHYGEWAGPGINSGEGLTQKTLALFSPIARYPNGLPNRCVTVPILYEGAYNLDIIEECAENLKTNGSKLVPGFMRPEGVVVNVNGKLYKYVFDPEETAWTKGTKKKEPKEPKNVIDYNYLCQPIRLEKLLSRDERLLAGYPATLSAIVSEYVKDLVAEGQITGDEDQIRATKKGASGQIFKFVKSFVDFREV